LGKDIGEKENLVDQNGAKADELLKKLQHWRENVNAQYPAYNPNYRPEKW